MPAAGSFCVARCACLLFEFTHVLRTHCTLCAHTAALPLSRVAALPAVRSRWTLTLSPHDSLRTRTRLTRTAFLDRPQRTARLDSLPRVPLTPLFLSDPAFARFRHACHALSFTPLLPLGWLLASFLLGLRAVTSSRTATSHSCRAATLGFTRIIKLAALRSRSLRAYAHVAPVTSAAAHTPASPRTTRALRSRSSLLPFCHSSTTRHNAFCASLNCTLSLRSRRTVSCAPFLPPRLTITIARLTWHLLRRPNDIARTWQCTIFSRSWLSCVPHTRTLLH